jgi:hypothetical protein
VQGAEGGCLVNIHPKERIMDSTITRTGIATAVKRRRVVAAATTTVAACICAAAYIAGPAIAQDAEQDRSATPP